ncbi:HEPN domain-containing protein [Mucilaginibacter pedocola]|nr:HEPN domain-containing protein [Mucilaginibacter pedocola]
METVKFDAKTFQPKHLVAEEIADPILVIRDFFSQDWLQGHLESLARWRKYVIGEGYYQDKADGPAGLLFIYKLNVRLVEAMYMLSRSERAIKAAGSIRINFDRQLQQEREDWLHYPTYLSQEECIDPYRAIRNFFDAYTVNQYSRFLNEWLETGLSAEPIGEEMEVSEVIYFYEQMQKLYEAVWVIRQRETGQPVLKIKEGPEAEVTAFIKKGPKQLPLFRANCRFNERIMDTERVGATTLTDVILKSVSATLMVIHLGTYPDPDTFYLLIVTDEKDKTPEHEIVNKIENLCKPLINVCAIVHKSDGFIKGLEDGNRLFFNAIEKHKILYRNENFQLPLLNEPDSDRTIRHVKASWERWGVQGKIFLDTAQGCYHDGHYNLAAFLLHQSVESTLIAIVRINLGYRLTIHNLARMLRLTLIFTDDLINVFDLRSVHGAQLFELLQNAYSAARYKEDYKLDEVSLKLLTEKIGSLYNVAEHIYRGTLQTIED